MDTIADTRPETLPESSGNGLESKNRAGNRRGMVAASQANLRRGAGPAPLVDEEPGDAPDWPGQQLRDMRHVYSQPATADRTPGQRTCRRWLRADPRGFMSRKTSLEEEALAAQVDEEFPFRLHLDERRSDPNFCQDNTVSLILGIGETDWTCDRGHEFLLTLDELARLQQNAQARRLPIGQFILRRCEEGLAEKRRPSRSAEEEWVGGAGV